MRKINFAKDVDGNLFVKSVERIGLRKPGFMNDSDYESFRDAVFELSDFSQVQSLKDKIKDKKREDYTDADWETNEKISLMESAFNYPTFDGGKIPTLQKLFLLGLKWFFVSTSIPEEFETVYKTAVKYQKKWLESDTITVKEQEDNLKEFRKVFIDFFKNIEDVPEEFDFSVTTWILKQLAAEMFKRKSGTTGGKGVRTGAIHYDVVNMDEAFKLYSSAVLQALGYGTFPKKQREIYG